MNPQAGDTGPQSMGLEAACHEAAIGLGSNLGRSLEILLAAWQELQRHPAIFPVALSSPYRSQPVGMDSDHWFVNAAALIRTSLPPLDLLRLLHRIEARHGRVRESGVAGYQDRTLDLDLLLFDALIVRSVPLILPHPSMDQRLFVLEPLTEIGADRVHPLTGKRIRELLVALKHKQTQQWVERMTW